MYEFLLGIGALFGLAVFVAWLTDDVFVPTAVKLRRLIRKRK